MGAWIETLHQHHARQLSASHPTWVRGLKHHIDSNSPQPTRSHPTWVRGLKPTQQQVVSELNDVAPYVGAWIETPTLVMLNNNSTVAPYVGAWIETMAVLRQVGQRLESHPTWVRGLKLHPVQQTSTHLQSHPTWVRGLKQKFYSYIYILHRSHPTWVRGLKPDDNGINYLDWEVAPYVGAWIETRNETNSVML